MNSFLSLAIFFKRFICIIFLSHTVLADVTSNAQFICRQITEKPNFKYENYFSSSFIQKIKYEQIVSIFQLIFNESGRCKNVTVVSPNTKSSKVLLLTQSNSQKFFISVDQSDLISGLQYYGKADPTTQISNSSEVALNLSQLGDISSVTIKNISLKKTVLEYNSNQRIALGSEFKLYILNYLNEQILKHNINWNDKIKINDNIKSLPSGILQDYPQGTELTLKQFAGLMISKSDNTATDHLIWFLEKEKIENSLYEFGEYSVQNIPFLTTMDMFRLRTLMSNQIDQYLILDAFSKRKFLNDLELKLSREAVAKQLQNWDQPKDIQKVEWYSSTSEICNVTEKIKNQADQDQNIYDILSLNVPFIWLESDPYFDYVGYKGGSEPGVLTMTFLVKTKKQDWACISMGVNNQKQSLDENQVADVFHAVLNYAGKILNE